MIIKKRTGVFETNSSSAHSIVVTEKSGEYNEEEARNGFHISKNILDLDFRVDTFEFCNTPFNILFSFDDKLKYAIASYFQKYNGREYDDYDTIIEENKEVFEEIDKALDKYFPDLEEIRLPKNDYYVNKETDYYQLYFGYVDHQSKGLLQDFLEKEGISLSEFLINKKYVVIIDGDEYCIYNTMKEIFGFKPIREYGFAEEEEK